MNIKNISFLSVFALLTFSAFAEQTQSISQQELLELIKTPSPQNFVVLDVRTEQEFNEGHIAGALNISHDQVSSNLAQLASFKDKLVIVHCRSGKRAAKAENILTENGFSQLRHLTGDMNAWQASNLPTVSH